MHSWIMALVKKLIKSKSGLRIVTIQDEHRSPFIIEEPTWVPDREITKCTNCSVEFGFTRRKHHCRRCGQIYCNDCSEAKVELLRMCFVDPVRVCQMCESKTRVENRFFSRDIKLLSKGAIFLLRNGTNYEDQSLLQCKLSGDHRYLLFDGASVEPIEITQITSLDVSEDQDTGRLTLNMTYQNGDEDEILSMATTKAGIEKANSNNWLRAIQQAHRFLERSEGKGRS